MFPTTVWTQIHDAGAHDEAALDEFARRYRSAVLDFIHSRGFRGQAADDLCQDVFLRLLHGRVLAKADRERGRFRSLLRAVTKHVIHDHLRRRRDVPVESLTPASEDRDFDHGWALSITERALETLRNQGSPYYDVLRDQVTGQPQSRTRLWNARRKLAELIRREVALTCANHDEYEQELAYLSRFLRPSGKT